MGTFIIPTSTVEHLAKKISQKRDIEVIFPDRNREGERYFPDGEIYVKISRINKLKRGRLIILHSGAPQPNKGLVELELILQVLKDKNIRPEIFFTYFPYSQQDKVFEKGESNVAENLIKKLINYYKVKKIYLIDPHFGGRKWIKKYPIKSISAVPLLIKKVQQDFGPKAEQARFGASKNVLFLSPDKGGKRRTGISGLKKKRLDSFEVKYFSRKMVLKGKIIGAVDDIIETGGTLLRFYDVAKKSGAKKIIVLATHGVLPSGLLKIKKRYSKLYLTNTINQKGANVDVSGLILKTLFR